MKFITHMFCLSIPGIQFLRVRITVLSAGRKSNTSFDIVVTPNTALLQKIRSRAEKKAKNRLLQLLRLLVRPFQPDTAFNSTQSCQDVAAVACRRSSYKGETKMLVVYCCRIGDFSVVVTWAGGIFTCKIFSTYFSREECS